MVSLKEGWQDFLQLCCAAENNKALDELLHFLLTPEEKANLAARCLIIKELLNQQKTQRHIAKDLQVSIAKVTRGSNQLKRINPKLLAYLRKQLFK